MKSCKDIKWKGLNAYKCEDGKIGMPKFYDKGTKQLDPRVGHATYLEEEDLEAIYKQITDPIFRRLFDIVMYRKGTLTCEQEVELFLCEKDLIGTKDKKIQEILDKKEERF